MASQNGDAVAEIDETKIKPFHAERLRWALSTRVGNANADIDPGDDVELRPVTVTAKEIAKSTPFGEPKCRALLDQLAGEPTSGLEKQTNGTYVVDPRV